MIVKSIHEYFYFLFKKKYRTLNLYFIVKIHRSNQLYNEIPKIKKCEGPINKLKKIHNFFWNFLILKRGLFGQM